MFNSLIFGIRYQQFLRMGHFKKLVNKKILLFHKKSSRRPSVTTLALVLTARLDIILISLELLLNLLTLQFMGQLELLTISKTQLQSIKCCNAFMRHLIHKINRIINNMEDLLYTHNIRNLYYTVDRIAHRLQ